MLRGNPRTKSKKSKMEIFIPVTFSNHNEINVTTDMPLNYTDDETLMSVVNDINEFIAKSAADKGMYKYGKKPPKGRTLSAAELIESVIPEWHFIEETNPLILVSPDAGHIDIHFYGKKIGFRSHGLMFLHSPGTVKKYNMNAKLELTHVTKSKVSILPLMVHPDVVNKYIYNKCEITPHIYDIYKDDLFLLHVLDYINHHSIKTLTHKSLRKIASKICVAPKADQDMNANFPNVLQVCDRNLSYCTGNKLILTMHDRDMLVRKYGSMLDSGMYTFSSIFGNITRIIDDTIFNIADDETISRMR
jgi:hypothetical protein